MFTTSVLLATALAGQPAKLDIPQPIGLYQVCQNKLGQQQVIVNDDAPQEIEEEEETYYDYDYNYSYNSGYDYDYDYNEDYEYDYDYSGGGYSSSYEDFIFNGVIYDGDTRYTWYSQSVLSGGGLDIPCRHTSDGFVRDGDGRVCVASNDYDYGTIVDTPFGEGVVYDSGCDSGTIDVYIE